MSMTNLDKTVAAHRNRNLDLIKLISCIAVVVLHCLYTPEFEASRVIYQLCAFAVPCFFIASGYVLLNKQTVSWSYVRRKLLGIARIVLIWNTIVHGVELMEMIFEQGAAQVDYLAFLRHYVSFTLRSVLQRGTMWQFWYLGATGLLYLLLPVLHGSLGRGGRVADRPGRALVFWCVLLAVSVTVQTVCMVVGRPVQQTIYQTLRLWSTLQYFLLGGLMPVMLQWLSKRVSVKLHLVLAAALTVLTLGWRLLADHLWIHGILVEYYYDDLPTIIWIAIGSSALMRLELKPFFRTLTVHMAPLTMGVYILHVPIRDLIRETIEITGSVERLVYAAAVCMISFLCAYIIKKLPFGKYLTEI